MSHIVHYEGFYWVNGHRQIDKDPGETLPVIVDLSNSAEGGPWLVENEIIDEAPVWDAEGLTTDSTAYTDTTSTITLSGGMLGDVYTVKYQSHTTSGRLMIRRFRVRMVEK
jgi:hypothetical protein